jgi:hypothetical protein
MVREMSMNALGIKATTLTPFAYHSLMVPSGSATLPELISDSAVAFGLAAALGWLYAGVALPAKDYRRHWRALPYRASLLTTTQPRLLPPLIRRLNLDAEAGIKKKIQDVAKKGNLKDFYQTQEIPEGQVFTGAIFGFDPFRETGQNALIIRVGLHRAGMLRLEPDTSVREVSLNAGTAALFGRELAVERYCLYGLQRTPVYLLENAAAEVGEWGFK